MKLVFALAAATLVLGCATRQSVEADGIGNSSESNLTPIQFARCIANNIDGKILGSLKAAIEPDLDRVDVVVRNGGHIWSLAKIRKTSSGSHADFLYGAAGKVDVETSRKWMIQGCAS